MIYSHSSAIGILIQLITLRISTCSIQNITIKNTLVEPRLARIINKNSSTPTPIITFVFILFKNDLFENNIRVPDINRSARLICRFSIVESQTNHLVSTVLTIVKHKMTTNASSINNGTLGAIFRITHDHKRLIGKAIDIPIA